MNSPDVDRAEKEVERSAAQFETAMHHLGERIETATGRVRRTLDKLKAPKRALERAGENSRLAVDRVQTDIREVPPLYAIGSGIILAAFTVGFWSFRWRLLR